MYIWTKIHFGWRQTLNQLLISNPSSCTWVAGGYESRHSLLFDVVVSWFIPVSYLYIWICSVLPWEEAHKDRRPKFLTIITVLLNRNIISAKPSSPFILFWWMVLLSWYTPSSNMLSSSRWWPYFNTVGYHLSPPPGNDFEFRHFRLGLDPSLSTTSKPYQIRKFSHVILAIKWLRFHVNVFHPFGALIIMPVDTFNSEPT